jgi:hypothetical protein
MWDGNPPRLAPAAPIRGPRGLWCGILAEPHAVLPRASPSRPTHSWAAGGGRTPRRRSSGLPPTFEAEQTQEGYAENLWPFAAGDVIAPEVARFQIRLVRRKKGGATEPVVALQALETLSRPQPPGGGKTMRTR